jgi:hypothetical protein
VLLIFVVVILHVESSLECCMVFCVMRVVVLYFSVLHFIILHCSLCHCSTLPLGINQFAFNNNKILKINYNMLLINIRSSLS